jgi:hypothetical protein
VAYELTERVEVVDRRDEARSIVFENRCMAVDATGLVVHLEALVRGPTSSGESSIPVDLSNSALTWGEIDILREA